MEMQEKRTELLQVVLAPSEKATIKQAAKEQAMTVSSFMRWAALNQAKGGETK